MITRALSLLCLVLSLPVSAQQPISDPPSIVSRAFDPGSAAIKKIVRDSAATQFSLVQLSDSAPARPAEISEIDLSAPPKIAAVKQSAPSRPVAPPADDFLSALVETLVDVGLDHLFPQEPEVWRACKPASHETTLQIPVLCSTKYDPPRAP